MERSFFDWKFFVTLAATVAGVVVPIYLWQADLSSRSLTMRLVSAVSLLSDKGDPSLGLRLMLDGQVLNAPYLSTIEITNDGSKPIAAADFDSPIELRSEGATLIRANVSSVQPPDLQASLTTEGAMVRVQPLLLNPGDVVTLGVLTSGSAPLFVPRARIAGVPRINYEDQTKKASKGIAAVATSAVALLAAALYFVFATALIRPSITLGRGLAAAAMIVCSVASSWGVRRASEMMGVELSPVLHASIPLVVGIAALPFFLRRVKRDRQQRWQV